ncbi:MAG TPA: SxtJ family membrane protein [Bacteroidales bacterium]|nr:SxtJ family membrane protein [Bacteroidales bacterium]
MINKDQIQTQNGNKDRPFKRKAHTDAGMALVLILLLMAYFVKDIRYAFAAIPVVVVAMTLPSLLLPFTWAWQKISHGLGYVMSSLLLGLIFLLMVVPVGMIRQGMGYDPLMKKSFKKSWESVFKIRDHKFTAGDLEKPY